MGRQNHHKDKDETRIRKLYEENQHLKRSIKRLEKELSKIDVEKFTNLQEIVAVQEKEDKQLHQKNKRNLLKEKWHCWNCEDGYLSLIIVNRLDGIFYFRRCKECGKKTKLQRYSDNVEGIKE